MLKRKSTKDTPDEDKPDVKPEPEPSDGGGDGDGGEVTPVTPE